MRPRFDSVAALRVVLGALGIGTFPLLALGYQARVLGSASYATLAIGAFVLLGAAIGWPEPPPLPRTTRTTRRPSPPQQHHHA